MPRYTLVQLTLPPSGLQPTDEGKVISDAYVSASLGNTDDAIIHGLYEAKAEIEADNTDQIFIRTQNIDAPWTSVHPPLKGSMKQRSTSVGDYTVSETGEVFKCSPTGWEESVGPQADAIRNIARTFREEP